MATDLDKKLPKMSAKKTKGLCKSYSRRKYSD